MKRKSKFRPSVLIDPPIRRVSRIKGKPGATDCKVLTEKEIKQFKKSFAWKQWQEDKAIYDAHQAEDRRLREEYRKTGKPDRELLIAR